MTDAQRAKPPPIGSIVRYRFFELSKDGVPRFPTFVGEGQRRAGLTFLSQRPLSARTLTPPVAISIPQPSTRRCRRTLTSLPRGSPALRRRRTTRSVGPLPQLFLFLLAIPTCLALSVSFRHLSPRLGLLLSPSCSFLARVPLRSSDRPSPSRLRPISFTLLPSLFT